MHGDGPCLFIVGMHRSGTSATAGALAALGMAAPSGADRTSTTEWNERGNFESKRLMAVNDRLLSALGGTWSGPPDLEPGWECDPALDDLRARASRAFAQSFPRRPTAWKDPRSCLTLPFWRTVVTAPVAGVLVYRDPLEVARSLERRDGVSLTYGLALWERYVRSACAGLVGLPTMVTEYTGVLENPALWIDELVEFLRCLDVPVDAPAARAAVSSLDAGLRQERQSPDGPSGLGDDQGEILAVLRRLGGSHLAWKVPDLGPEPQWVKDVVALRRQTDLLRGQLADEVQMTRTSRAFRVVRFIGNLTRRPTVEP